ncbi:hypothetical protein [Ktedonospora formicarum]|nr:hypothetical protein [Ktedonospora formicarum]
MSKPWYFSHAVLKDEAIPGQQGRSSMQIAGLNARRSPNKRLLEAHA